MLQRGAQHPRILLAHGYDPAPVVAACAAYYHQGGPGTHPTYPVDQRVRAEMVRAWADSCSDPALEWLLATNLIARWFVGLPLVGSTPDHSTRSRFHTWLTVQQPAAFFRDSLAFVDRVDPEPPATTPQIVDTFAMASPAAPTPSPTHLLGQLTVRLMQLWRTQASVPLPALLSTLDLDALSHPPRWRTTLERQQQLQTAVQTASQVATCRTPHLAALAPPDQATAQTLITAIYKVIADETTTDATGQVQERPNDQKGTYRLMSVVDLEATFRKHEGDVAVFGPNAVLSTTATRIRAAVALTGSIPASEAPAAVIRQLQAQEQPLPPHLVMDRAGGWGKTRATVLALSDGRTQMVAHIPHGGGADLSRFTPADFRVDAERTACTCPNGVTSTKAYASQDGDGVHFRFLASQCRACPLWTDCRGTESNPKGHRTVFVSDYHAVLRAAAHFNASAAGKALLQGRWQVAPTMAWLTRYHGWRQARRVGLAAAQCQLFQACAVRNLLLWLRRVQRGLARRLAA